MLFLSSVKTTEQLPIHFCESCLLRKSHQVLLYQRDISVPWSFAILHSFLLPQVVRAISSVIALDKGPPLELEQSFLLLGQKSREEEPRPL